MGERAIPSIHLESRSIGKTTKAVETKEEPQAVDTDVPRYRKEAVE